MEFRNKPEYREAAFCFSGCIITVRVVHWWARQPLLNSSLVGGAHWFQRQQHKNLHDILDNDWRSRVTPMCGGWWSEVLCKQWRIGTWHMCIISWSDGDLASHVIKLSNGHDSNLLTWGHSSSNSGSMLQGTQSLWCQHGACVEITLYGRV